MTKDTALRMALEALDDYLMGNENLPFKCAKALAAIREALAQPEPAVQGEPVAHTLNCVCGAVWDIKSDGSEEMAHTPDTTPPHRKPLSDEEIGRIAGETLDAWSCARAIEAAHGIKE